MWNDDDNIYCKSWVVNLKFTAEMFRQLHPSICFYSEINHLGRSLKLEPAKSLNQMMNPAGKIWNTKNHFFSRFYHGSEDYVSWMRNEKNSLKKKHKSSKRKSEALHHKLRTFNWPTSKARKHSNRRFVNEQSRKSLLRVFSYSSHNLSVF